MLTLVTLVDEIACAVQMRRVTLNGRELFGWRVRHADLVKGGELCFFME